MRVCAACAVALVGYIAWIWQHTPDVRPLREGPAPVSSVMRIDAARIGIAATPPEYVSLGKVTPLLSCAVVKAEDVRFFSHGGFDWPQLWLAIRRLGQRGGASTITQQLARNLFLSRERTLHRKMREAFAARRMETTLGKERILELYLNIVPLGPRVWGVRSAAAHYFDTTPAELDAFEVVLMTSLIAAPNAPLTGANLERAVRTQRRVLSSLHMSGLVDFETFVATHGRLQAVAGALSNGETIQDALHHNPAQSDTHSLRKRSIDEPMPLAEALARRCGHDREIAEASQH